MMGKRAVDKCYSSGWFRRSSSSISKLDHARDQSADEFPPHRFHAPDGDAVAKLNRTP